MPYGIPVYGIPVLGYAAGAFFTRQLEKRRTDRVFVSKELNCCPLPSREQGLCDKYCVRASCKVNEEYVVGLSSDWGIVSKVSSGCFQVFGKTSSCKLPKVSIQTHGESCDGRVYHVNKFGFARVL